MASGFPFGAESEFYGSNRSIHGGNGAGMNSANGDPLPSQRPYRAPRLPGIFLDPIGNRPSPAAMMGLTGKRPFADFQTPRQFQNPAGLNDLLHRSVKPRNFQNLPSPISPLTQIDLFDFNILAGGSSSHRLGSPFLRQPRHQQPGIGFGSGNPGLYPNPVQNQGQKGSDMMVQLKELEKQLLEDDDGENYAEDDAISGLTNRDSEWSKTLQSLVNPNLSPNQTPNLVSPNQIPNLVSSSPTPSASSSTSSPAASSISLCSRQTIMEIAKAISDGKFDVAAEIMARASHSLNLKGNSNHSEQKILKFMLSAFRSLVDPVLYPAPVPDLYGEDHLSSIQSLYEISPCFNFGFIAANVAILDAMDSAAGNGFHLVDFDVRNGGQYLNLFEEIWSRKIRPMTVKITAVTVNSIGDGNSKRLKSVGDMLRRKAAQLGLSVRFDVVACTGLAELTRESIGCDSDEPLAVNLAYKLFRVPDESVCIENPRDELLRRVKGLAPRVVTLIEHEMNANTAPFTMRVNEVAAYYSALLDSVEATGKCGDSDRVKIEERLSRKIANAVVCEGMDRVERCEVYGKWRVRMSMAGFEQMTLGESVRNRLGNGERVNSGFTVKEVNGSVCFGWMGRTLAVASAWR